jgi:hypothetical protein
MRIFVNLIRIVDLDKDIRNSISLPESFVMFVFCLRNYLFYYIKAQAMFTCE